MLKSAWLAGVALVLVACSDSGPGFALHADPAGAPAFPGSPRWLDVRLDRASSGADITIRLAPETTGAVGDTVVFAADMDREAYAITVDEETPAGPLAVTLVASDGEATAATTITLDVQPALPSSQALIADALAAGRIDPHTALLYRAQAAVGSDELPAEYRGSGATEDAMLSRALASDPALRAYSVRPTSPESIYAARTTARTTSAAAPDDCSGGWRSRRSTRVPVRVWIECQDAVSEASELRVIDLTLRRAEAILPRLTAIMGEPLLDAGGPDEGGDDAIDIYLVQGAITRGGQTADVYSLASAGVRASARMSPPLVMNAHGHTTSSGYIVAPRIGTQSEDFRSSLTHELFHILEFAHNVDLGAETDRWFFYEASAVWASVHVDRVLPWPARVAAKEHRGRFGRYVKGEASLNAPQPAVLPYAAYIWPYFLEQETGSPAIIGAIWRDVEAAATSAAADDILDRHYSFAQHFHRFSLRNLNQAFPPSDPIAPHYNELDDQFPDGDPRPTDIPVAVTPTSDVVHDLAMPPLSAKYLRLDVAPGVKRVEIDLSGLQPRGALDVDALIKPEGDWLAGPLSFTEQDKLVFCFDRGPATAAVRGSFEAMELVLSNHARAANEAVDGRVRITGSTRACGAWSGSVQSHLATAITAGTLTIDTNASSLTFTQDESMSDGFATFYAVRDGALTYHAYYDLANRSPPCRTMIDASGPIIPSPPGAMKPDAAFADLIIYAGSPQDYEGSGSSWVTMTKVTNCNDQHVDEVTTYLDFIVWWQPAGGPYTVQPDGTIADSADATDVVNGGIRHTTWSFTRVDE